MERNGEEHFCMSNCEKRIGAYKMYNFISAAM